MGGLAHKKGTRTLPRWSPPHCVVISISKVGGIEE